MKMKKKTGLIILAVLLVIGITVAILLIHSNQKKADQYTISEKRTEKRVPKYGSRKKASAPKADKKTS